MEEMARHLGYSEDADVFKEAAAKVKEKMNGVRKKLMKELLLKELNMEKVCINGLMEAITKENIIMEFEKEKENINIKMEKFLKECSRMGYPMVKEKLYLRKKDMIANLKMDFLFQQ